jgi:hypothetical protein
MVHILLLAVLAVLSHDIEGTYQKYLEVPPALKAILDQHVDELTQLIDSCEDHNCDTPERVKRFSWLPDYYVKYDTTRRIPGAALIAASIEKYGLNLLAIPQKYVYHIPGRDSTMSNHNYLVVSPSVERLARKPLNLAQVKQLLLIGKYAQFTDWRGNLFFTASDTLTFIDTGYDIKKRTEDSLRERYLHSIHNLVRDIKVDDEAYQYIIETLTNQRKKASKKAAQDIKKILDKLPGLRKPLKQEPPQS